MMTHRLYRLTDAPHDGPARSRGRTVPAAPPSRPRRPARPGPPDGNRSVMACGTGVAGFPIGRPVEQPANLAVLNVSRIEATSMPPRSERLWTSIFSGSPRALSRGAAALTRASVRNALNSSPSRCPVQLARSASGGGNRGSPALGDEPWTFGTSGATGVFWSLSSSCRIVEWIAPGLRCSLLVRRITADRVLGTIAFWPGIR